MLKTYRGLKISGVAAAVPENIREMLDMAKAFPDLDSTRTIKNTGVERVRVAGDQTTASDLCYVAARKLFLDLNIEPSEVDALIFASVSPDYLFPPTSHILQHRLGLKNSTPCFDLSYGCTGYSYGLLQAAMLISSKTANKVLLLVGDTPTKTLRADDHSTLFLFGDAGSATLVESDNEGEISIFTQVDGSQSQVIRLPNSAYRKSDEPCGFIMNGIEVFNFALKKAPEVIRALLGEAGINIDDVDMFVFHQANKLIVEYLIKNEKLNAEKVLLSLKDFGNTASTSIPLLLVNDAAANQRKKERTLLCSFGSGLSWNGALVDLSATHFSKLEELKTR